MDFNGYTYDIAKYFSDNYGLENMFTDKLDNLRGESFILFKLYLLGNYQEIKGIDIENKFNNFCISNMKISLKEFVPYGRNKKKTFLALFYLYDSLEVRSDFYFDFNNYMNQKSKKGEKYDTNLNSKNGYMINDITYQEINSIKDDNFFNNIYIKNTINIKIYELIIEYLNLHKKGYFSSKYELKDYKTINNLFINDISNIIKNTGLDRLDSNKNLYFLNNSELYYLTLMDLLINKLFNVEIKNNYNDYSNWDEKIIYINSNYSQLFTDLKNNKENIDNSGKIRKLNSLDELNLSANEIINLRLDEINGKYKLKNESNIILKDFFMIVFDYFYLDGTIEEISFLLEHLTNINNKLDFLLSPSEEISEQIKNNIYINDEINKRLFDNNYLELKLIKKGGITKNLEGSMIVSGDEKFINLIKKHEFGYIGGAVHRGKVTKYDVMEKIKL